MKLIIKSIGDKGDLNNERIGLSVISDCELKFYLIFKTTFTENGFYNRGNAAFWFAPQKVKAGDRVVVYTKAGTNSVKHNSDGSDTYFFYWGLKSPIFINDENGIVLSEIESWQLSKGK